MGGEPAVGFLVDVILHLACPPRGRARDHASSDGPGIVAEALSSLDVEQVIKCEGFSDEQQAVPHNNGPETEIGYRLAWARTYLKAMGLLTNSSRGVWALTDQGSALIAGTSRSDDQRRERVREIWSAHMAG
jgi:Mrr N-terminal domain